MHIKYGIKLGDLQEVVNLLGEVEKFQTPALIGHSRKGAHQLPDPRAVNVSDVGQVHQNIFVASTQLVANHLTQLDAPFPQGNSSAEVNDGYRINLACYGLHAHGPFLLDWALCWNSIS